MPNPSNFIGTDATPNDVAPVAASGPAQADRIAADIPDAVDPGHTLAPKQTVRNPNDPPEPIDFEWHAKALFTVFAQSMRAKGHMPPAWEDLPAATRGTFVTALASVPSK